MSESTDAAEDTVPECPPADVQSAIQAFRRHAFNALLAGESPSLADIAERASSDATDVTNGIAWLEAHGAVEREGDQIVGAHGLTLRATPHVLSIGDRTAHTWCAFDALAIPVALGASARAATTCPSCRSTIVVDVHDGELPDDRDLRLWLPGGSCQNVIADFCAHANLFCTGDHLTAWHEAAGAPPGRQLRLADVPAVAGGEWADIATGE